MLTKMGYLATSVRSGMRTTAALEHACPILMRTNSASEDEDITQFSLNMVRERECAHNGALSRHTSLM